MKTMLKHYFTHPSVWTYILIGVAIAYYLFSIHAFADYFWVMLLPIPIAPFFEWWAHKYILHMRIGNIRKEPLPAPGKVGEKIKLSTSEEEQEFTIIAIQKDHYIASNGLAKKAPFLYRFMSKLHYGHHQDPDNVPLIFAPILSVLILFAGMFLLALLISWSTSIALMFLLGVVIYYLHYEWMHLGHHIKGYNHIFPWSRRLKKAHSLHHYKNENYWWGITNFLGDLALGTYKDHKEIEKSPTVKDINP